MERSPKDVSCCAPKSCADVKVQQRPVRTRPARRGGRARRAGGPSAPPGLAALPVDQRGLLLLGQGLPLLPVLPAAVQQGEAVLRHARQGLRGERERTLGGSRQPGRCPSPGRRPRATSLPRAVRAGWGSARCDRWRVRLSRYAAQGKHTVRAEAPDPGGRPGHVTVLPGAPALGLPRWSPHDGFTRCANIDFHPRSQQ